MPNFSDVTVNVYVQPVVSRLGFGIPLLVEGMAGTAKAYDTYTNIDEVITEFGDTGFITKAARRLFAQENRPEKIACVASTGTTAACLADVVDEDFRQVIAVSVNIGTTDESSLKDVADWCEANGRMLFCSVHATSELAAMAASRDTYDHVVVVYQSSTAATEAYPEAALVGATAGKDVGSFTYKNQILKGMVPEVFAQASDLTTLHNGGIITVLHKAGDNVMSEGLTYSGKYIDLVDSKDWLVQQITYQVQKVLNNNDKVPYDNNGINLLDSAVITVLKEAYSNGMIADDADGLPDYYTAFARREDTAAADRVVRKYVEGKFGFTLAGAVHNVVINGYLEI